MEENYLNLLNYQKSLKSEGKILSKENEQDYKKLINYEISILDHLKWSRRSRYFILMSDFLDKKIDADEYICELFKFEAETQNLVEKLKLDFEMLKEFEPNSLSKGFSKLTEDLCSDCRIFEPDSNLRDDYELSEKELLNNVKKIYLQLLKYL